MNSLFKILFNESMIYVRLIREEYEEFEATIGKYWYF